MKAKLKVGDKVKVYDRSMKTHGLDGKITGIEKGTDSPVYNVLIELVNKENKKTGRVKNINLLESQITKE